jgi:peptide/nickel transport system substrate-binding protein
MKFIRFTVVAVLLIALLAVAVVPSIAQDTLPRNETLYFNGQQWGAVVGWNPYSSNNNNAMTIAQQDNARVLMFETPYLYNMLDGNVYPLLADGDYAWNDARTELTFKIKAAAHWSDDTPVTADDVAYTWATHIKYETPTGASNKDYIEDIVASDPQTVVIKASNDQTAVNRCPSRPMSAPTMSSESSTQTGSACSDATAPG